MTNKVTVKANAGNFAFDGNEGCKGRLQMGQLSSAGPDRIPIPSASDENHFTVSRTGEMGVLWSPSLES
jgi:hypothetical protein